jgi:hypothetical protein
VPEDALYDVHVDVLLAEQGSAGVADVMEPGVLGDSRFAQESLPLFPVVMGVNRPTVGLTPDEIPVLPIVTGGLPLGVLGLEVVAERGD